MDIESFKVIHVPFTKKVPYQKLLGDALIALGLRIEGAQTHNLFHISFLNISFFEIFVRYRKPDIIHLHWQHSFLLEARSRFKTVIKASISIIQLILLKFLGVKLVWTVHNLLSHERTYCGLEKRFTRILAQLCDVIIAHCHNAKKEISARLNISEDSKIIVIPQGNYIDYYPNTLSQEEAKNQLSISKSEFTILFFGEVRYYKGVLELIDAFQLLNSESAQLLIVGDPYNNEIVEEIKIRINGNRRIHTIFKFIPDDELQKYINASDILVYPYRDIFTSGGIILSMSFGKPIIAPCIGYVAETLDHDGSFLYDPKAKDGLLTAIRKAYASKSEFQRMGKHNLYLAKELNWDEIAKSTRKAYLQI